jgi:hypothetical protein
MKNETPKFVSTLIALETDSCNFVNIKKLPIKYQKPLLNIGFLKREYSILDGKEVLVWTRKAYEFRRHIIKLFFAELDLISNNSP